MPSFSVDEETQVHTTLLEYGRYMYMYMHVHVCVCVVACVLACYVLNSVSLLYSIQ